MAVKQPECPIRVNNTNITALAMAPHFVASYPADGKTLKSSPTGVTLNFSTKVRADKSIIRVYDPNSNRVKTGGLDNRDNGQTLSILLPGLKPGRYRVQWRTQCDCKENKGLEGNFSFIVK